MRYGWILALGLMALAGTAVAGEKTEITDEAAKTSYSIGYQMGGDFKRQGMNINPEILLKGLQDAMSGSEPRIPREEMRDTLMNLQKKLVAARDQKRKVEAAKNLAEGTAFLAENGKKEGVRTLPSGLQYQVLQEGAGASPKATDTVTVHYQGKLIDGTEFDSSYARGKPATFQLNRVIKGWTEGLQLMKPGAKYRLFIPPGLAYGERGGGARIPPNSTLVFEVELVSIGAAK